MEELAQLNLGEKPTTPAALTRSLSYADGEKKKRSLSTRKGRQYCRRPKRAKAWAGPRVSCYLGKCFAARGSRKGGCMHQIPNKKKGEGDDSATSGEEVDWPGGKRLKKKPTAQRRERAIDNRKKESLLTIAAKKTISVAHGEDRRSFLEDPHLAKRKEDPLLLEQKEKKRLLARESTHRSSLSRRKSPPARLAKKK